MTKKCSKCGEVKLLKDFTVAKSNKDGKAGTCKACVVLRNKEHYRTIPGLINQMYNRQKRNSKDRNHVRPNYDLEELTSWLMANGVELLHKQWVDSDYAAELKPSVDRLDSTKPYSLDTIRLVTWKENNDAAYSERKSGKRLTRQNRRVRQLTPNGTVVADYPSISNAARVNNFCRTNINSCLRGLRDVAHGFRWGYLESTVPSEPTNRDKAIKRKEKEDG